MRIRYYTDKNEAATEYNVQAKAGNKSLLLGPVGYVVAPNLDPTSPYVYDAAGAGNIYVLIVQVPDAVASFDVPKQVPPG